MKTKNSYGWRYWHEYDKAKQTTQEEMSLPRSILGGLLLFLTLYVLGAVIYMIG